MTTRFGPPNPNGSPDTWLPGDEECAICLELLSSAPPETLPCGHVFHGSCVESLRKFGLATAQVCPLCRSSLPPGQGQVYEVALRRYVVVAMKVSRGGMSWETLVDEDQKEISEVVRLFIEAAEHGDALAQTQLGFMYGLGQGTERSHLEAMRWTRLGAEQGNSQAQFNLSVAYSNDPEAGQKITETIHWLVKAAEQEHANAQCNLGSRYWTHQ